jgi:hypothetical protein
VRQGGDVWGRLGYISPTTSPRRPRREKQGYFDQSPPHSGIGEHSDMSPPLTSDGRIEPERLAARSRPQCTVKGCEQTVVAKGLCSHTINGGVAKLTRKRRGQHLGSGMQLTRRGGEQLRANGGRLTRTELEKHRAGAIWKTPRSIEVEPLASARRLVGLQGSGIEGARVANAINAGGQEAT